jgi:hypothetical protein
MVMPLSVEGKSLHDPSTKRSQGKSLHDPWSEDAMSSQGKSLHDPWSEDAMMRRGGGAVMRGGNESTRPLFNELAGNESTRPLGQRCYEGRRGNESTRPLCDEFL